MNRQPTPMLTPPTTYFQPAVKLTIITMPTTIHMRPVTNGMAGNGGLRPTCPGALRSGRLTTVRGDRVFADALLADDLLGVVRPRFDRFGAPVTARTIVVVHGQ